MRTGTRRPEAVPFSRCAVQKVDRFLLLRYESWSHSTCAPSTHHCDWATSGLWRISAHLSGCPYRSALDRLDAVWTRLDEPKPDEVALAGGVGRNGSLRDRIGRWGRQHGVRVRFPDKRYCTTTPP